MLAKNLKTTDNQHQQEAQSDGDESLSVQIQPQKKQITTHTQYSIKYQQDEKNIVFYIELDPKNIVNLNKQINKNKAFDDDRRYYKNCIMIKKIETPESNMKGNFRISYLHYKGLTFTIQFIKNRHNSEMEEPDSHDQSQQMFAKMKINFKNNQNWQKKWINSQQLNETDKKIINFQLPAADVDKVLKQKLLLQIIIQKYIKKSKDYVGIRNEGNTCYVNSTLQVLYHFLPFRKKIIELSSQNLKKHIKGLQQIFVDLMTQKIQVNAQSFLKCFQINCSRQQDIHQFLISFFEILQNQLPEVADFWTGKDYEITESKEKKYYTKLQQNFTQLQLLMIDSKGVNFKSISQSLMQLVQEDTADQPIDTQQFGKLIVTKSRYFQSLPPLLFMNIKRYQYNAKRKELKKINLSQTYPKKINLDFLMQTPQNLDYVLYAVVVHKGRSPNSGHYFCFINLSKQVQKPKWYQFNDSHVRMTKQSKVINNYTGKKKTIIQLNQQYGKWVQTEQYSEETAYLLTYIRKDLFQQYQNIQIKMPSWQIQRLQLKLTQQQSKTMSSIKVYVLAQNQQFRPFEYSVQLQEIKLIKNQILEEELKKFQKHLSCKIGSIWKVNCKTKTIKHIHKQYGQDCRITVARHTDHKRGIRQPDYFIIIPAQRMKTVQQNSKRNMGILHIVEITQQETIETVEIDSKQAILKKFEQLKNSGAIIDFQQDQLQYFLHGWNGYLRIQKS